MEKLKCEKITTISVDYYDLEKFIEEYYGHDFSIVADLELNNDTAKTINVSKDTRFINKEGIEDFINHGKYGWLTFDLLNDLCSKGEIEEGNYTINVSW